jgi:galactokinase
VRLPAGVAVLVVHSGVSRALAESEYARRREACEAIARDLGVAALRDARPADVAERPLARHVVSENGRVVATAEALAGGDLAALGELFAASHASLRDDYRVSTPELDGLVVALVRSGALGARLTGAGFGGCVVALVAASDAARVADEACARYRAETGRDPTAFVCEAVAGAGCC